MKRLWIVVVLVFALVLSACGPAATPAAPAETAAPVETAAPAETAAPVEEVTAPTDVQPAPTQPAVEEPTAPADEIALDGKTLLEERCTVCHTLDRVESANHPDAAQWESVVSRMIGKGAVLSDAEIAVLVDYLSKEYPGK